MTDYLTTVEDLAAFVREHAAAGRTLRPRGAGTKLDWAAARCHPEERSDEGSLSTQVDVDTRGLDGILAHNRGDFTAVLEAGVPLARAQAQFARAGQMLALDPPLGGGDAATVGGILAAGDSGPLRHRYGGPRDLVLGMTVVLSDGSVCRSGGTVIKNVAGYDLSKLFVGSFGTLGVIARVAVRLHPLLVRTASLAGASDDPDRLAMAVQILARLPLEAECFDVTWAAGWGRVLLRFGGAAPAERARAAADRMSGLDPVTIVTEDDDTWLRQRAMQRSAPTADGAIVLEVSGRPTDLPALLRAADASGGTVVSRAALGLSWVTLPPGADIDEFRRRLAPRACRVLDGARLTREPWPAVAPGALALMRRVKTRFDPAGAFRPGAFVGGI